ncbi:CDP-glucose 4,6-dehydratase [Alishewanella longhuensis]|uniref:CDP-glucose 4,6-dehydratase n=1 Tax=Alishewanella longhuensis TaxID=1091037 RepID=A0ABQ3KZ66_9ALTE|nr:CDP-glucose 4,6-dehydratase [Alishewanella longhuensis]GHG69279.1 CDP-glucose 4,6-dehydratase [Alishewanella longhuensis]
MEDLVESCFNGTFASKRVLLTGHTGFKGSWLALWLQQLGAEVTGLSLAPDTEPAHWSFLNLTGQHFAQDVCDAGAVREIVDKVKPELVLHLAAQPLVRQSYTDPITTWQTNVMGTVNVLEACRLQRSVRAVIAVTTDKVYDNTETGIAFTEQQPLGGHDPYSASKAACELVVQSYRRSFFASGGPLLASARAGNVIGGGDWAAERLIPDVVRACHASSALVIRSPNAVRPWQHVLDSLSGYLLLAAELLRGRQELACSWNFGPAQSDSKTVLDVLTLMQHHWPELCWQSDNTPAQWHEAGLLRLDTSKAGQLLQWQPIWNVSQAAEKTALWYQAFYQQQQLLTQQQLQNYIADARHQGAVWTN